MSYLYTENGIAKLPTCLQISILKGRIQEKTGCEVKTEHEVKPNINLIFNQALAWYPNEMIYAGRTNDKSCYLLWFVMEIV